MKIMTAQGRFFTIALTMDESMEHSVYELEYLLHEADGLRFRIAAAADRARLEQQNKEALNGN